MTIPAIPIVIAIALFIVNLMDLLTQTPAAPYAWSLVLSGGVVIASIVPLGAAFGIHPIHLGIIFIANLELGYLTPPVGLNLFLASYRFEKPLLAVYRAAVPMLIILGIGVLLITYVPWLTTVFVAPQP